MHKPVVYVGCSSTKEAHGLEYSIHESYITALTDITQCAPVLLPPCGAEMDLHAFKNMAGILLTGDNANIHPNRYGENTVLFDEEFINHHRDTLGLQLIHHAIENDIPLLAICRGFQELNVAMGGSLHQKVHRMEGMLDHRADKTLPERQQFEQAAHTVTVQKGGLLERIGLNRAVQVNSLHAQGVNRIGQSLFAEAVADDGLVEALSFPGKRFILGVQWHPEGDAHLNPVSVEIFKAFGEALYR